MTKLLLKWFVKDYDKVKDEQVRKKYGFLSSIIGIVCNVILFGVKYLMGVLAGSVSITSDAFNNLSDAGNCILTLFGYKMAAKPADKDHPFGHGRLEYLMSLIIAVIIMLVGVELLKTSVDKVIHPKAVVYSTVVLVALVVSIAVKLWLSVFNNYLGKRINSTTMLATAKDSRNDVIATLASIVALVASLFTDAPVDGAMGIFVSLFILYGGYGIIKDTVDELLGKPADKETVDSIKLQFKQYDSILGIHDLVIHSYGPGVVFGSVHAEVDCHCDIMEVHDTIDIIEHNIYNELGVIITIHMDPVDTSDEKTVLRREMIARIIEGINPELTFHDFRMVSGPTHTNLVFDVVIPFECSISDEEVKNRINEALSKENETYYAVVSIDRDYT